jgi:EmrB/QacA subfamily drug resistance transporter
MGEYMTANATAAPPAVDLSPRAKLEILLAILLALFLFALDQTVVGVALPRIITDLGGNELYNWSITIYLLTSTISGPIYGKLSDLFGRRPIILFAVSLFLIASALCGLSQEMWQFILFRGLQGLGGGALFPVALAVIADMYTPAERGKYLGSFGAVFGLSSLVGPALGGVITDNFGWAWVFYVNVPLGLVSLFILYRLLPSIRNTEAGRNIDYLGAAVFTVAIGAFLVGLTNVRSLDLNSLADPWVGGLMLVGLVLAAFFIWVESRAPEPIVPLGLFRLRTFTIAVIATFFAAFGFLAAVVFLPRWYQTVAGASATESGYNILPLLFGLIFAAMASGQIVARTGRYRWLVVGAMLLLAVGLWMLTNLHANTDRPVLWFWMLITGLGIGPAFAVFTLIVQNSVSMRDVGVATASVSFFQQIGGTVGLTIAGTVFASTLSEQIPRQLVAAGLPQQMVDAFGAAGGSIDFTGVGDLGAAILAATPAPFQAVVAPLIPNIVAGIHEALSVAIAATFWIGIGGALVAAAACLFLREAPMRATFELEPDADPTARGQGVASRGASAEA